MGLVDKLVDCYRRYDRRASLYIAYHEGTLSSAKELQEHWQFEQGPTEMDDPGFALAMIPYMFIHPIKEAKYSTYLAIDAVKEIKQFFKK